MNYFKFSLLVFIITLTQNIFALDKNDYQKMAQLTCDQLNGKTDYDYEKNYSSKLKEKFSKQYLDTVFIQLKDAFGKCLSFKFPEFNDDPTKVYIITDKKISANDQNITVKWTNVLDEYGVITSFYQNGYVDETKIEKKELMVEMSDGVKLQTIIYKAFGDNGKAPVVLTRTPYLEKIPWETKAKYFIKRGYTFVIQSIRGMYGSEGSYKLFSAKEGDDGFDTINWIAQQSFCDGNVAITGTSYDGFTSLAAGVKNPKALKLIFTGGAPSQQFYNVFRVNGTIHSLMLDYLRYKFDPSGPVFTPNYIEMVNEKLLARDDQENFDEILFGIDIPEWNNFIEAQRTHDKNYFKERSVFEKIKDINVPTYHIAGMVGDGDLLDTVSNFIKADKHSPYKNQHRLILGEWGHGGSTPYGEIGTGQYIYKRYDSVLAHYLKKIYSRYTKEPRVVVKSLKGEGFITGDRYPIPSNTAKMFLTNEGLSNQKDTNPEGSNYLFLPLSANSPEQMITFSYKFNEDVYLWGPTIFNLFFTFNTPQMDLMVYFEKIDDAGNEIFLGNGVNARVVENNSSIVNVELKTEPLFGKIKTGESIKITVTSNIFPTFFRNKNNSDRSEYLEADITLLNSIEYPSSVTFNLEP